MRAARSTFPIVLLWGASMACAQQVAATNAGLQLTIYNDKFAVVRTMLPLDLHPGVNEVTTSDVTRMLEPDSVVLRFPGRQLGVLEQNYDAGVVDEPTLLSRYEGKTLKYQVTSPRVKLSDNGAAQLVPEMTSDVTIVRGGTQPIFVVDGHLQFFAPGRMLFPSDTKSLLLKPTLNLRLQADRAERSMAELGYITRGLAWQVSYNLVVPEAPAGFGANSSERGDLTGWVTMHNDSGENFENATVQLMAGDVAKIVDQAVDHLRMMNGPTAGAMNVSVSLPTEKPFDDFHLYALPRSVTLLDHEIKQVQLLNVSGIDVQRSYQYDSTTVDTRFYNGGYFNEQQYLGVPNKKVGIREEVRNARTNRLGIPLPSGRLRLYRRETSGQLQFVGESLVPHTPQDQVVSLTIGNAFDLTGDRRQTHFQVDGNARTLDESYEIKLSNAKAQPVTIHAVEHLNRGENWKVTGKSMDFDQRDSTTIDFPVLVPANGSVTVSYSVHYSW